MPTASDDTRRHDFRRFPDVASRALGGSVMIASDDFYGDVHQLIAPGPATHDPTDFGPRGKTYDGWETRRRRSPGVDYVIIRLAVPAVIHGVGIDTAYFRGNFPAAASVEATTMFGYPDTDELLATAWEPLLHKTELEGHSANAFETDTPPRLATHLRLTIYPDGGVARFNAYGEIVPDPRHLGGRTDLAALLAGGLIEGCSNMFYSAPANVLRPGFASVMSDGWETARRRGEGNDWLTVQLAAPGLLHETVIDTQRFVGNSPGWASLTDVESGAVLLPRTKLVADTEHRFRLSAVGVVRQVRLDIYPDGGISRLRLRGSVPSDRHADIANRWLSLLPPQTAASIDPSDFFA